MGHAKVTILLKRNVWEHVERVLRHLNFYSMPMFDKNTCGGDILSLQDCVNT